MELTRNYRTETSLSKPAGSDHRLIAALCYLVTPVVPIVALRGAQDDDQYVRKHARQGLIWAIPFLLLLVVTTILIVILIRLDILFICLLPAVFIVPLLPGAYLARRVYFGRDVTFPGSRPGE